jgi:predicted AAA+ superfamily ATPase
VDLVLDFGQHQILVEIKLSRTFREEFTKPIERLRKHFKKARGVVVSFSEQRFKFSDNIQALPWWDFLAESL